MDISDCDISEDAGSFRLNLVDNLDHITALFTFNGEFDNLSFEPLPIKGNCLILFVFDQEKLVWLLVEGSLIDDDFSASIEQFQSRLIIESIGAFKIKVLH